MIELGLKSDPIETRYSFKWLFELMNDLDVRVVQIGSFFELYILDLAYFEKIRNLALINNIQLRSVFTAHRELGGFFYDNLYMEKAARTMYERLIEVAAFLGADYCGSNPGAVYRDQMYNKNKGIDCYLKHMKELSSYAHQKGLKGLTIEPMSCAAEPPTSIGEIRRVMTELNHFHLNNPENTVPFYMCGDISHGWAGFDRQIIQSNYELFEAAFPWMCEFHYKNTDQFYESTFGFSKDEQQQGIVNLNWIHQLVEEQKDTLPFLPITGYLEIGGPKVGRDYSDKLLGESLSESVASIKNSLSSYNIETINLNNKR